jgi:hypothetical protein
MWIYTSTPSIRLHGSMFNYLFARATLRFYFFIHPTPQGFFYKYTGGGEIPANHRLNDSNRTKRIDKLTMNALGTQKCRSYLGREEDTRWAGTSTSHFEETILLASSQTDSAKTNARVCHTTRLPSCTDHSSHLNLLLSSRQFSRGFLQCQSRCHRLNTAFVLTAPEICDVHVNLKPVTNSMQLWPSRKAASCAAAQELKNFLMLYGTQRFSTVITRTFRSSLSRARSIRSILTQSTKHRTVEKLIINLKNLLRWTEDERVKSSRSGWYNYRLEQFQSVTSAPRRRRKTTIPE